MKASHLVMILEHIIDEYGDMNIQIEDGEATYGSYTLDTVALCQPSHSTTPGPVILHTSDLSELRHSDTDRARWRVLDATNDIVASHRPEPPPEAPYVAWVP